MTLDTDSRHAAATDTVRDLVNAAGKTVGSTVVAQIEMRKAESGEIIWSQEEEAGSAYGVTISPDGKTVGCCSGQKILLFDAEDGALLRSIEVSP